MEIEDLTDKELIRELNFQIEDYVKIKKKNTIEKIINTRIMRMLATEAISRGLKWKE